MKKNIIILSIVVAVILLLILTGGFLIFGKKSEVPNTNIIKNNDTVTDHGTASTQEFAEEDSTPLGGNNDQEKVGWIEVGSHLYLLPHIPRDMAGIKIVDNLASVQYCGETYQTKQVILHGVDLVQRISYLLEQKPEEREWYCEIIDSRAKNEEERIKSSSELRIIITDASRGDKEHKPFYGIAISLSTSPESSFPLTILPEKNSIFFFHGKELGVFKKSDQI